MGKGDKRKSDGGKPNVLYILFIVARLGNI